MDADKLKSKIREALGAAGIGRDIAENVDKIIDSMTGKKDEEKPVQGRAHRVEAPKAEPARFVHEEDDDDEDDVPRAKAAETRAKPARKTKAAPRKKK